MNSLLISLAEIEQDAKDANMSLLVYFFYFEEAHFKWLELIKNNKTTNESGI